MVCMMGVPGRDGWLAAAKALAQGKKRPLESGLGVPSLKGGVGMATWEAVSPAASGLSVE